MAVDRQIMEERIPLPVTPSMAAGLRRLSPRSGELKGCVMMLHGLGQNSDIFMDEAKGIGLAYFLVEQGYEVFICLYRGRDASRDTLKKEPFGFEQLLSEDLPLIWKAIEKRQRHPQRFLVGYQLGGVLWGAFLARNPEKISQVTGMIHFNPRRSLVSVGRWKRLRFGFFEQGFQRLVGRLLGFLPAVFFSKGMVRESRGVFEDLLTWRKEAWQDHWDGFDYHKAMPELLFPPSLYFVSLQQRWLKPEIDCRNFMFELPNHDGRMIKLSVKAGNQKNYSVSELCSSIDAETDYYPLLLAWLQNTSNRSLRHN